MFSCHIYCSCRCAGSKQLIIFSVICMLKFKKKDFRLCQCYQHERRVSVNNIIKLYLWISSTLHYKGKLYFDGKLSVIQTLLFVLQLNHDAELWVILSRQPVLFLIFVVSDCKLMLSFPLFFLAATEYYVFRERLSRIFNFHI